MLLSAVSVLVVAQSSSEIPEGLMNNPVLEGNLQEKKSHMPLLHCSYHYVARVSKEAQVFFPDLNEAINCTYTVFIKGNNSVGSDDSEQTVKK